MVILMNKHNKPITIDIGSSIAVAKIEYTFYIYDNFPILFVAKDENNTRFLCSCCKLGEQYVIVETSISALLSLMDNSTTIRDIFSTNYDGFWGFTWDGKHIHAYHSHNYPLNDWLPRPGAKLNISKIITQPYYDLLKSEL